MKNTIITSLSALVFLVIGLFIGKSYKQIEIQTVLKTNIVEKPVVEYVVKYVTNNVDSINNVAIDEFKIAEIINNQLKSAKFIKFDKLPNGIDKINVRAVISDEFKNTVNPTTLKDAIELEVRNAGLKIDETASYSIIFYANGFDVGNNLYATHFRMVLLKGSYFLSDDQRLYLKPLFVWEFGDYGAISKNLFNQKYVLDKASSAMVSFRNKYLESKQNEN